MAARLHVLAIVIKTGNCVVLNAEYIKLNYNGSARVAL